MIIMCNIIFTNNYCKRKIIGRDCVVSQCNTFTKLLTILRINRIIQKKVVHYSQYFYLI